MAPGPLLASAPILAPPSVRTRSLPCGLPSLSETQARDVRVGTKLLLNFIQLCHAVAEGGGYYALEHPEDPGSEPYPSIWVTDPVLELLEKIRGASIGLHRSAFYADSTRKAARLGSNPPSIASLQKFGYLDPIRDRKPLIGKDPKTGKFRTSQAQVYRLGLCQAIAHTFEMHIADTTQTIVTEYNAGACREGKPPDFPLLPAGVTVEPIAPSEDIGDLICDWNWRTVFSHPVTDNSHINFKEPRAVRLYLKRQAKSRTKKGRVIVLVDSQVARGAPMRGRSPSKPINRQLRRLLPMLLGGQLYPSFLWIPSEANPSDASSRVQPLWGWLKDARSATRPRGAHQGPPPAVSGHRCCGSDCPAASSRSGEVSSAH